MINYKVRLNKTIKYSNNTCSSVRNSKLDAQANSPLLTIDYTNTYMLTPSIKNLTNLNFMETNLTSQIQNHTTLTNPFFYPNMIPYMPAMCCCC